MKKIVTTLLAFLSVCAIALGFTACDGNEGEDKNGKITTVTENEWNSIFNAYSYEDGYYNGGKINEIFSNFKIVEKSQSTEGGNELHETIYKCNKANKVVYVSELFDNEEFDDEETYVWQLNNHFYRYKKNYYEDEDKALYDYEFTYFEQAQFAFILYVPIENVNYYGGYKDFVYDSDSSAYKFSKQYEDATEQDDTVSVEILVYFEDKKPVKIELESSYIYHGIQTDKVTYEFTYGEENLTVPQKILDMPLTEH